MTNAQWNRFKYRTRRNKEYWNAFLGFLVVTILTTSFVWMVSAVTWMMK